MTSRNLFACAFMILASSLPAQEQAAFAEDPAHDQLRAVRDDMLAAFKARDVDRMLRHVHPDVVVTFQNAEFCRGPEEVRAFFDRMMTGSDRVVESLESQLEIDDLSILHGDDTAVAFGSLSDEFSLKGGLEFSLDSRWTATLVRENGRWLIAAYHVSTNMFDNGVNDLMVKGASLKTGALALIVGLVVGGLLIRFVTRSRGAASRS